MHRVPAISVVLPVFNGERYVAQAIESIRSQTFGDFEFLIFDDGSTDATGSILEAHAEDDARIKLFRKEHVGVVEAANYLCRAARGDFIARIDADNVSLPDRLALQFRFLQENPGVGAVGTALRRIYDDGAVIVWYPPPEPVVVRWWMMFACPLAQGAGMMRRSLFERVGPYREAASEDYDFFIRANRVSELANLRQVLSVNRKLRTGLTHRRAGAIREESIAHQLNLMIQLLQSPAARRDVEVLHDSWERNPNASGNECEAAKDLLLRTYDAFSAKFELTRNQRASIAMNVLRRILGLALWAKPGAPASARSILRVKPALLGAAVSERTVSTILFEGARLLRWFGTRPRVARR